MRVWGGEKTKRCHGTAAAARVALGAERGRGLQGRMRGSGSPVGVETRGGHRFSSSTRLQAGHTHCAGHKSNEGRRLQEARSQGSSFLQTFLDQFQAGEDIEAT